MSERVDVKNMILEHKATKDIENVGLSERFMPILENTA